MKKRLALLGLALMFVIGSVFGGAFAPLVAGYLAQAATGGGDPIHSSEVANYRIQRLPRKSHQIGDPVPVNQPEVSTGVYYTISRRVGNFDILMGASHTNVGNVDGTAADPTLAIDASHPGDGVSRLIGNPNGFNKFELAGTYIYHFYDKQNYELLEFRNQNTSIVKTVSENGEPVARSFHTYIIRVNATDFRIELPENSEDILPNIMVPSPRSAIDFPEGHPQHTPPVSKLVLPLPKSLFDIRGRDLLDLDPKNTDSIEARRDAYRPELGEDVDDVTCADIVRLIYRDMSITFFGNPGGADRRPALGTTPSEENSIANPNLRLREFVPVVAGGMYYAEYSYFNRYNNISASFRTDNITVELPTPLPPGVTQQNIPQHIQLEFPPTMSFTPSSGTFRIGVEATLPTPTISVSEDSEIKFNSANTLTNFTYVAVRYRDENDRAWRWLSLDGDGKMTRLEAGVAEYDRRIMRIGLDPNTASFKFTPHERGEYQFWYYTTTIFGVGSRAHMTPQQASQRIHSFEGREFLRYEPFLPITILHNDNAPQIMWTADFDYWRPAGADANTEGVPYFGNTWERIGGGTTTDPAEALIDNVTGIRRVAIWGEPLTLENAPDHRRWLPGSTASTRTRIPVGGSLVIPALFGTDDETWSERLDYRMYLHRYNDGIRSDAESDRIRWTSGRNGATGVTGVNPSLDGGIWEHNRTFNIPFTQDSFRDGALLGKFRGFEIAGRYDLIVRAWDDDTNMSQQFQYTFDVVEPERWSATRPRHNGDFSVRQTEYHEGDTLLFNVANFTDDSTLDRDMEVRYFLSLDNGKDIERLILDTDGAKAIEIKDGEDGVTITGGVVSFALNRQNKLGTQILEELERNWRPGEEGFPGHDISRHNGELKFHIYAIARNYHAITRNYQVGRTYPYRTGEINFSIENIRQPATATPRPPNYIAAVYSDVTIFDMSFGAAAHITDEVPWCTTCPNPLHVCPAVGPCVGCPNEGHTCTQELVPSWYTSEDILHNRGLIAIPALRFYYPEDPTKPSQLFSTIHYEITHEDGGRPTSAIMLDALERPIPAESRGGAISQWDETTEFSGVQHGGKLTWNPNKPDKNGGYGAYIGHTVNQRYFSPNAVGTYYVTVTVTNAGGNISVFVGTIVVVGELPFNAHPVGGPTLTVRMGQTVILPVVEITINSRRYVTEFTGESGGNIMTAWTHPTLGRRAKVGEFETIRGPEGSSAGQSGTMHNNFVPQNPVVYNVLYNLTISNEYEVGHTIITGLAPGLTMTRSVPLTVDVKLIDESDMYIILDEGGDYRKAASRFAGMPQNNDTRLVNVNNFFTDMLISNESALPDAQLVGGLEPFIPSNENEGNFLPTEWQYGRIFLPHPDPHLVKDVEGLRDNFYASAQRATTWITVTKNDETLLNTLVGQDTANQSENVDGIPYYWFRPTGRLAPIYRQDGQDLAPGDVAQTNRNVNWALNNATRKEDWQPVQTPQGGTSPRVDGVYIVEYNIRYRGVETKITYQIRMGDIQTPIITLVDRTVTQDKFEKTYYVGQEFTFDTFDISVSGVGDPDRFLWENSRGEDFPLADSQRNPNFSIDITSPSGRPVLPGVGDSDYTILIRTGVAGPGTLAERSDWSEVHTFTFREPGTYTILITVINNGNQGTVPYRLTVEEREPRRPIAPEEVWGTILIIVSIGLLLGVVIYFIRTGQQTKFASGKNKPKRREKQVKEKEEDGDGGVV